MLRFIMLMLMLMLMLVLMHQLMLTGASKREVLDERWTNFDLDQ